MLNNIASFCQGRGMNRRPRRLDRRRFLCGRAVKLQERNLGAPPSSVATFSNFPCFQWYPHVIASYLHPPVAHWAEHRKIIHSALPNPGRWWLQTMSIEIERLAHPETRTPHKRSRRRLPLRFLSFAAGPSPISRQLDRFRADALSFRRGRGNQTAAYMVPNIGLCRGRRHCVRISIIIA